MSFTFKLKVGLAMVGLIFAVGCASTNSDSDLSLDDSALESSESADGAFDDSAEASEGAAAQTENSAASDLEDEFAEAEGSTGATGEDSSGELSLDEPASTAGDEKQQQAEAAPFEEADEFSEFEEQVAEVTPPAASPQENQQSALVEEPPPPTIEPELTEPPLEPAPVIAEAPAPPEIVPEAKAEEPTLAEITGLRYRANDGGGTFVIEAQSPLEFTTRKNDTTNQLIIEVQNAKLKSSLQRSINTRDMQGAIGSIDPYQNPNGTTARFVLQLRQGFSEPTVSAEGNSIVVVGSSASSSLASSMGSSTGVDSQQSAMNSGGNEADSRGSMIFDSSTQSLEEYLANNTSFSGRKISIEANVDIKEFFKLLTDEIGVNFVISEAVTGNVNIKLKQVPWDQALVVVMKSKKLGYTKIGNILRIAPLAEIKIEEEEAQKSILAKKSQSPLKVRLIPISYAKVGDVQTQITPFLSERGKVSADTRTSAIIVTDIDENIERVLKVIRAIDTPTQQVLIEGKIVEASESFSRRFNSSLGTNIAWRTGQTSFNLPLSSGGDVAGNGVLRFSATRIPGIGSLNAALGLAQVEDSIEILSSPRIITLNNEPANIQQTTKIPVVRSTQTTTGTTSEPQYIDVKLSLDVTPQVTNDNSVILTLSVNRDIPGAAVSSAGAAPGIESRSAKTKVMVKNGQTAVVGGIYQLDNSEGEGKVPVLGDIPVLGWLFKSTNKNRKKNELMIFVTPEILTQSQTEPNSGTELN